MARSKGESKVLGPAKPAPSYRETIEQERAARNIKTAKLRALRLAKEATIASEPPAKPKGRQRRKGVV